MQGIIDNSKPFNMVIGPVVCIFCGQPIPYTVRLDCQSKPIFWYCFSCGKSFPIGFQEFEVVGIKDHHCLMSQIMDISLPSGQYRKCEFCGEPDFYSEEVLNTKADLHSNYLNSLEFKLDCRVEDIDRKLRKTSRQAYLETLRTPENLARFEKYALKHPEKL